MAGSIPGQDAHHVSGVIPDGGAYGRQPIDVSPPHGKCPQVRITFTGLRWSLESSCFCVKSETSAWLFASLSVAQCPRCCIARGEGRGPAVLTPTRDPGFVL